METGGELISHTESLVVGGAGLALGLANLARLSFGDTREHARMQAAQETRLQAVELQVAKLWEETAGVRQSCDTITHTQAVLSTQVAALDRLFGARLDAVTGSLQTTISRLADIVDRHAPDRRAA